MFVALEREEKGGFLRLDLGRIFFAVGHWRNISIFNNIAHFIILIKSKNSSGDVSGKEK